MALNQAKRVASTSYGTTPQSVVNPDGSLLSAPINDVYDNAEWATGVVTDYDVSAGQSDAFSNITTATYVSIRTSAAITVKFNETTNASITVAASTTFTIDTLEVTNIFITAGSTANVKIFMS